jgi:ELWxxDGT repeat protein
MWRKKVAGLSRKASLRLEALESRDMLAFVPELVSTRNFFPDASYPIATAVVGETLFFVADDRVTGLELWRSDGTDQGTYLVKDINPGRPSARYGPQSLTEVNGMLLFAADDGVHGWELWRSDGTSAGTVLVKDIRSGPEDSIDDEGFNVFETSDGSLYFAAFDGVNGRELWKSDGTEAGTVLVKDIVPGRYGSIPQGLTDVNGTLYFTVLIGFRSEIWESDGTQAGTVPVDGSYALPSSLAAFGDSLYFSAQGGAFGRELWKTDGPAHATMVKDIWPGSREGGPSGFVELDGSLLFTASDELHGGELWKTDGTDSGTVLIKDIRPGVVGSGQFWRTVVDDTLYFSANDGTTNYELWRSDGTAAGTRIVKDINPGALHSYPRNLTGVENTLFFSAYHPENGVELWQSDGTESGTILVRDIRPGLDYYGDPLSANPESLTVFNGTLYFFAHDAARYRALYKLVEAPDRQLGDTDADGDVDLEDLANVRNHFGGQGFGDADEDGDVDISDLNAVRNNFGAGSSSFASSSRGGLNVSGDDGYVAGRADIAIIRLETNAEDLVFRVTQDGMHFAQNGWTGLQRRRLKAVDRLLTKF